MPASPVSPSPYEKPGFYETAIAADRHRDIVGGRWDETGQAQMELLRDAGLMPHHVLLDVGAGALRLGCKAVPFLDPGHYWATDPSRELMLAGHAKELPDPARLDPAHLVQDADFSFPGVPDTVTHAIAFAVFPHLPVAMLRLALGRLARFPQLRTVFFTVFLAPEPMASYRQRDGVVTHEGRVPFHLMQADVLAIAGDTGWQAEPQERKLPRGQVLFICTRS